MAGIRRALAALLIAVPGAAAAQVDADDAQEIVETLLGFDASRHASPLEAMHGWGDLYARYRDASAAGDEAATRVWLMIGFTALAKADAATSEAFAGDLMPIYRERPDVVLDALSENGWLVATACFYLGSWFDHEDREGEGRAEFLETEAPRIRAALHPDHADACLGQIRAPARPG